MEEWEPPRPRPARGSVVCRLLDVSKPVVWELIPERGTEPELDPALWFHSERCAERHYLLGNPHTFPGRLSAWCPKKKMSYCISKSELAECSTETTYFVKGFLSGSEPDVPVDDSGDRLPPGDLEYRAWVRATQLFQQTGIWKMAMSRRLLNLGDGRDGDHYADLVRGATATSEFSCLGLAAGP